VGSKPGKCSDKPNLAEIGCIYEGTKELLGHSLGQQLPRLLDHFENFSVVEGFQRENGKPRKSCQIIRDLESGNIF
jgi:hypothetical protein